MPLFFPFFVTDCFRSEATGNRFGGSLEFAMGKSRGHALAGERGEKLFPFAGPCKAAAAFVTINAVDNRYLCLGI